MWSVGQQGRKQCLRCGGDTSDLMEALESKHEAAAQREEEEEEAAKVLNSYPSHSEKAGVARHPLTAHSLSHNLSHRRLSSGAYRPRRPRRPPKRHASRDADSIRYVTAISQKG
jgi:hypothetical protein